MRFWRGVFFGLLCLVIPPAAFAQQTATQQFTLTVASAVLQASPTSLAFTAVAGGAAPTAQTLTIVSVPAASTPVTISADQPWITLGATSGTTKAIIQIDVNPTGLSAGNYSGHVIVTATGVSNSPVSIPVSLTVVAQLIFTSVTVPAPVLGQAYSFNLPFTGGVGPYTCSITAGSLPTGIALSLSGSSCLLSGTPTVAGSSTFTVQVASAQ